MDKVKCVETGNVFKSASDAAHCLNVSASAIYQSLNKGCATKGFHFIIYHNNDQAKLLENEILYKKQQKMNQKLETDTLLKIAKQKRLAEKENMITDLFKQWYSKELSIEQCAIKIGYSVDYLYKLFRNEKVMRGLE